jgi:hypothetical protein
MGEKWQVKYGRDVHRIIEPYLKMEILKVKMIMVMKKMKITYRAIVQCL